MPLIKPAVTVADGEFCGLYCSDLGTCSGHGVCGPSGECICADHFAGADCRVCIPDHFGPLCDVYCKPTTTCNGRGSCSSADGSCQCSADHHGAASRRRDCRSAEASSLLLLCPLKREEGAGRLKTSPTGRFHLPRFLRSWTDLFRPWCLHRCRPLFV